eukprot:TRINITY_DN17073_c0_g1_i6.p1 TRINITY_DN17073_c0_g1~~TRINITY_DN17073_c0_g1_i6.p1  ORF type:complete len:635 (-),score=124.73 TRINITY_DN17073_c0_g1_i6:103-2007(-)
MQTITSAGGDVVSAPKKCTHILISAPAAAKSTPSNALAKVLGKHPSTPVVSPEFLDALVVGGQIALRTPKLLRESGMLKFGSGAGLPIRIEQQPTQLVARPGVHASLSEVQPVVEEAEATVERPSKRRRKLEASDPRLEVDTECGVSGRMVLTPDGTDAYSVALNQFSREFNKYYIMQLIQERHRYAFFKKWGSVGECGLDTHVSRFSSRQEAIDAFTHKFKERTGNLWENKHEFVKKPGKYNLVVTACAEDQDETAVPQAATKQPGDLAEELAGELAPTTCNLVRTIFDAKMMAASLQGMQVDATKMPLGKLSRATILKAYSVLKTMLGLVAGADSIDQQVVKIRLRSLTVQFYHLIPHIHTQQCLASAEQLREAVKLVDGLLGLEASQSVIGRVGTCTSLSAQYKSLGIQIQPQDPCSHPARLIQRYVSSTHGSTHKEYSLQISNLFALDQPRSSHKFDQVSAGIGNRQLLWHGSRLGNWVGILSQGLRIAPPEAPVTGYMFGKGIYFANSVSKSANYCRHTLHPENPIGLLLLCEVALGNPQVYMSAKPGVQEPPPGCHSVKGCGRMRMLDEKREELEPGVAVPIGPLEECKELGSTLIYDEFIIYNEGQQRPRYLVEVRFCPVVEISDSE